MQSGVDTNPLTVNLRLFGREAVGVNLSGPEEIDLASLVRRLTDASASLDAAGQINLASGLLATAIRTPYDRDLFGTRIERWVTSWRPSDPLSLLVGHLQLAVSLNNVSSTKCVNFGLRRSITLFFERRNTSNTESLQMLLDTVLHFYSTTDLDPDLTDLRNLFESATGLPFLSFARIAGRLVVGTRHEHMDLGDAVGIMYSPQRLSATSQADLERGTTILVQSLSVQKLKHLLPSLYFDDAAASTHDDSTRKFLRVCFSKRNPPLILVFIPPSEETWLARTVDLDVSNVGRSDLYTVIKSKGVRAPEFPDDDGFLDRIAGARANGNAWVKSRINNVISFPKRPA